MQVRDGSWYQAVNKSLYQVRVSCGHFWLFDIKGDATGVAVLSSGRSHLGIPGAPHDLIREVSDPTKPLQLRVGGVYLDRVGTEAGPLGCNKPEVRYPFSGQHDNTCRSWMPNGTHLYGTKGQNDLICEILDPAPEPELVFVAGLPYETRDGDKRYFIGENTMEQSGARFVFSDECGRLSLRFADGGFRKYVGGSGHDIVRPWIDPPTEFVDPRNGKRYRVGEEIK